jgi:hypothetical protein
VGGLVEQEEHLRGDVVAGAGASNEELMQDGVGGLLRAVGEDGAAAADRQGAADLVEGVGAVPAFTTGDHDRVGGDLGGEGVDGTLGAGELPQTGDRVGEIRSELRGEKGERQAAGRNAGERGACPGGQGAIDRREGVRGEQAGDGKQLGNEVAAVVVQRGVWQVARGVEGEGQDGDAGEGEQPDCVRVGERA